MIADQVESHLNGTSQWSSVSIVKDLARLKRIVVAQRNAKSI